jgi:multiple sugar transport system permease protein
MTIQTKSRSSDRNKKSFGSMLRTPPFFPQPDRRADFFCTAFFCGVLLRHDQQSDSHQFVFLDNFKMVLQNNAFRQAAKNTLSFRSFRCRWLLCFPRAGAAAGRPGLWQKYFQNIFSQPHDGAHCVHRADLAGIVSFKWFCQRRPGRIWHRAHRLVKSQYNQWTVILLFLWKNLGYNMILFMASLSSIPHDMIEAAMLDGAGPWHRFIHIKLRYLSPTVLFVTILSLINSFKVFREVYLLTGDYPMTSFTFCSIS